jgi:Zn-dependent protease with chaperone function
MTKWAGGRWIILALVGLGAGPGLRAAESVDAYTERITRELAAKDPAAAALFREGNAARDRRAFPEAERLYREVRRLEPGFVHATRRLCGVVLNQGRRGEALTLCREALAAADTPENHEQLLLAILGAGTNGKTEPTVAELQEARAHASLLLKVPDPVGATLFPACQAAIALKDLAMLRSCVERLRVVAPDEVATHYYAWIAAMSDGDVEEARAELERAHRLGLPDEQYAALKAETDNAGSGLKRLLPLVGVVLGAWAAGLVALFGVGLVLSRVALKVAQRPPTVQTGESVGLTARLRSTYRVVLWVGCLYYYLSLPIVLAVVLLLGGGLIYLSFAFGHVPVKLVALIAIVMLVTVWATLKSVFVRPSDADPGDRLEEGRHPRLRQVLGEVARQIGTRPVDNVYMTPGTELAVTERGGLLKQVRGASERCLILGVGVLDGMKKGPFKAVLAHEYGHFSNRDTAGGGFALAVRRSWLTMAYALAAGGAATWYNPAWLFLRGFSLVFLRISQGASRLQEIMADRWAAFAYGAAAFEQGLRHVVERSVRFQAHASSTLQEVVDGKLGLANLYVFKPSKGPTEGEIMEAVGKVLAAPPSPYDSHPSPAERFALVHALPMAAAVAAADDGEDAWGLFDGPAVIQCWMTDRIRTNVEKNHGVTIPRGGG